MGRKHMLERRTMQIKQEKTGWGRRLVFCAFLELSEQSHERGVKVSKRDRDAIWLKWGEG
jgi:hypothetical protein